MDRVLLIYFYESYVDNTVPDCSQHPEEDLQPILREEVEIAVAALTKREVCRSYKYTSRTCSSRGIGVGRLRILGAKV